MTIAITIYAALVALCLFELNRHEEVRKEAEARKPANVRHLTKPAGKS